MTVRFNTAGEFAYVESAHFYTDVVGFDAYLTAEEQDTEYPVTPGLHAYAKLNARNDDDVNEAVNAAYEAGWEGLGALRGADGEFVDADVSTDHYGSGYYGNGHLCELIIGESNARSIRHMLEEINAAFFEESGMFFYDLGHSATIDLVTMIERGLSDYPLVNEMDHSELELLMIESQFQEQLPALSESVSEQEVYEAWADQGSTVHCPECGTGQTVEEILQESDYSECEECGDWFDPASDGAYSVVCAGCARSTRKAVRVVRCAYGFDPASGAGLIVRMHGDTYKLRDGRWVPHTAYRDEHVIGE